MCGHTGTTHVCMYQPTVCTEVGNVYRHFSAETKRDDRRKQDAQAKVAKLAMWKLHFSLSLVFSPLPNAICCIGTSGYLYNGVHMQWDAAQRVCAVVKLSPLSLSFHHCYLWRQYLCSRVASSLCCLSYLYRAYPPFFCHPCWPALTVIKFSVETLMCNI